MNRTFLFNGAYWLATFSLLTPNIVMSQTNQTDAHRWLAMTQPIPLFTVANSKSAWEKQRRQVRAQLWEMLGKLPPRPKLPKIETISREDRGDYAVEKFQFDN